MATKLLKMGGKKKELRNQVVENEGKKKDAISITFLQQITGGWVLLV